MEQREITTSPRLFLYDELSSHGNMVLRVGANDIDALTKGPWIDELFEKLVNIGVRYTNFSVYWSDIFG